MSKQIEWVLDKALPDIVLSKQSIILDNDNLTDTFNITTNSDGNLSVSSSNDSIATVSLSGNTVTVEALTDGNVTITVSIAESSNYLSGSASLSVNASFASTTLNDNSWETISQIAKAGTASNYWSVGDCKEITLNGKVGDHLTLSNTKLCVFILDFNHPMNGTTENNIIFGGFKTALQNGTDVALVDDDRYDTYTWDGTIMLSMNHWGNVNYGGWKGCDLRYDILGTTSTPPSEYGKHHTASCVGYDATVDTLTNPKENTLLAALPSDLRSNIRLWTRWINVVGNSDADATIEATVDVITLLAECEIFASRDHANQYEQNHNTRMAYYVNGNGTIKKSHSNVSAAVIWWEASPDYDNEWGFCRVDSSGNAGGYNNVSRSYGLAPAFKI